MTNGKTADKILKMYPNSASREFWLAFYADYFSERSDWDEFWLLVKKQVDKIKNPVIV